ncbi:beta-propeller domain-containing protein [Dermatobacter hominis]|uniref:beta-propeller domain-containing protein n=1 Tax=Dermatobacter hominis TaxID=2884263 RepID=UPI001D114713|nr:beta-propeller domain-containing protein [Dermatobacter hominis]UDY37078.1 beta-propeller domain-containing protein [Dermatobacter hominis]
MRVGIGTGGNTSHGGRRAIAVALVGLAAVGLLAGCTQDIEGGVGRLRSEPIELADVSLVRASSCDDLVATAEAREQAIQDEIDRQQRATDSGGAVEELGDDVDAAGAESSASASSSGPATTVAPAMPADAAAPTAGAADGAQQRAGQTEQRAAGSGDTTADGTVVAGTNNQEQGVDEGDLVKTDGRRLVTLTSDGVLRVVGLDGSPSVDGELVLTPPSFAQGGQLLLRGDEVVAVVGAWDPTTGLPSTQIARIDLADPARPTLVEQVRVAGEPVATRMVDGRIRVVLRPMIGGPVVAPVPLPPPVTTEPPTTATTVPDTTVPDTTVPTTSVPDGTTLPSTSTTTTVPTTTTSTAADADDVSTEAARLLPQRLTALGGSEPLGGCDDVLSPPPTSIGSGGGTSGSWGGTSSGMTTDVAYPAGNGVTVLTVADTLADLAPVTVEGGVETVYAGTDALYTTATAYGPEGPVTAVHRFDLAADGPAAYTGSGLVPGSLLNQYSLSDRDGALRVVTTASTSTGAVPGVAVEDGEEASIGRASTTAGRITVLRPDDAGTLREVGHLDDLGVTEQVKSVRFIEDRAYVVTFRQTDPLFAVDLSDDTAPRLLGELKLPGFSEYLHPIGDGRLLGIGSEADERSGGVTGFKATLFDVSDPTAPKELDSYVEAGMSSTVGYDPHSFTWDPVRRQAVVPMTSNGGFGCPADAQCSMPGEVMPTEPMPMDDVPSTTIACPAGADCGVVGPTVGRPVAMPWTGAYVIGVDGDVLTVRGKLVHEPTPGAYGSILRSVVVDADLWTVSDAGVGRTDAQRPTGVALLPF